MEWSMWSSPTDIQDDISHALDTRENIIWWRIKSVCSDFKTTEIYHPAFVTNLLTAISYKKWVVESALDFHIEATNSWNNWSAAKLWDYQVLENTLSHTQPPLWITLKHEIWSLMLILKKQVYGPVNALANISMDILVTVG